MECSYDGTNSLINVEGEWWSNVNSGSEMPIQTRQPKIHSSLVREDLQIIMAQTKNDCRFRSSLKQILHANNVCLLEDTNKDWGMSLFRISHGSFAVDQTSGDVWIGGWSQIFVLYKRNSNAKFLALDTKIVAARNRIIHNTRLKIKVSLEEQKSTKRRPFPSWKTDRFPDLRELPRRWSQRFSREFCRWISSGIRIGLGRNPHNQWRKYHLMKS